MDRATEDQPFGAPVLGHEGEAGADRRAGILGGDRPSRDPHLSRRPGSHPEDRLEEFGATGTDQSRDPDHFPRRDRQVDRHAPRPQTQIARLEDAFGSFFATKTRRELYEQALERRIMLAPCNDAAEISRQPQLRHRELFTSVDYPELGASIEHPDFFAKSSRCRIGIRRRAPRVGEHNAELYGELGIAGDRLRELAASGVV